MTIGGGYGAGSPTTERADLFKFIRTLWSSDRKGKQHQLSSVATSEQKATGLRVVRRFQNRFECGCPWPQGVLAPEECPTHPGSERVYIDESVEVMTNVEVLQEG